MNKKRNWVEEAEAIADYYSDNKNEIINELINLIYEMSDEMEGC